MTIDLTAVKKEKKVLPPRILLYGPEKIGKSELLAQMPDTIFFDIEEGTSALSVYRYPEKITIHAEFIGGLKTLAENPHNFSSLVIDTADRLEELIHRQAAQEAGKKTVAEVDYGKGYVASENIWREVLDTFDYLRNTRGIAIYLICHSAVRRFDDPTVGSYDRYSICLYENSKGKGSADLVSHWVDATFFVNLQVFKKTEDVGFNKKVGTAAGGGNRFIYPMGTPSFVAGNRWKIKDPIPFVDAPSAWAVLQEKMMKGIAEE